MTMLDLKELRTLAKEATPPPWSSTLCKCGDRACRQQILSTQGTVGFDPEDAALIVALVNSLPAFLSAAEKLEVAKEALEQARHYMRPPRVDAYRFHNEYSAALAVYQSAYASVSQALAAMEAK